ncbi:unnamed protein product [Clavelina lepadiformis]|uniref:Uncharacterized protein n=1 Tax=Clavelina lepadiformis TaxID=159417 RepID=A0ABP0GYL4_CLALP
MGLYSEIGGPHSPGCQHLRFPIHYRTLERGSSYSVAIETEDVARVANLLTDRYVDELLRYATEDDESPSEKPK